MELSQERVPMFLPRKARLAMGVDLGKSVDRTALCVISHEQGITDYGSQWERHTNQTKGLGLQKKDQERWRCVHMEYIPLGRKYGDAVQHIAKLLAAPQLRADPNKNQSKCDFVLDAGGVGGGVAEMFQAAGL